MVMQSWAIDSRAPMPKHFLVFWLLGARPAAGCLRIFIDPLDCSFVEAALNTMALQEGQVAETAQALNSTTSADRSLCQSFSAGDAGPNRRFTGHERAVFVNWKPSMFIRRSCP